MKTESSVTSIWSKIIPLPSSVVLVSAAASSNENILPSSSTVLPPSVSTSHEMLCELAMIKETESPVISICSLVTWSSTVALVSAALRRDSILPSSSTVLPSSTSKPWIMETEPSVVSIWSLVSWSSPVALVSAALRRDSIFPSSSTVLPRQIIFELAVIEAKPPVISIWSLVSWSSTAVFLFAASSKEKMLPSSSTVLPSSASVQWELHSDATSGAKLKLSFFCASFVSTKSAVNLSHFEWIDTMLSASVRSIELSLPSAWDIESEAFDSGKPFSFVSFTKLFANISSIPASSSTVLSSWHEFPCNDIKLNSSGGTWNASVSDFAMGLNSGELFICSTVILFESSTSIPLWFKSHWLPSVRLIISGRLKRAFARPLGIGVKLSEGLPILYSAASGEPNATERRVFLFFLQLRIPIGGLESRVLSRVWSRVWSSSFWIAYSMFLTQNGALSAVDDWWWYLLEGSTLLFVALVGLDVSSADKSANKPADKGLFPFEELLVFLAGEFGFFGFNTRRGVGGSFVGVGFTWEFGISRIGDFGNDLDKFISTLWSSSSRFKSLDFDDDRSWSGLIQGKFKVGGGVGRASVDDFKSTPPMLVIPFEIASFPLLMEAKLEIFSGDFPTSSNTDSVVSSGSSPSTDLFTTSVVKYFVETFVSS